MTSNSNLGAYGIMYVIKTKKNEVISLLLKNGVTVPSNANDLQNHSIKNFQNYY
jgi:hypothetical protein